MKPVLYDKSGTKEIGVLADAISASVSEQRNGAYTASFMYPYVSDHFSKIDYDSIIQMKPNQKSKPQKFRVSTISKPINGIISYGCEHISYELNKNPIMVVRDNEGTAQSVMQQIINHPMVDCFYTVESDIEAVKKCEIDFMSVREAVLKVQQYFGGEFEWDNNKIILHNERGVDSGAVISYGVNLLDYTHKLDVSNVYTAIAPYMQITDENGEKATYNLPERIMTYYNADNYYYIRAKAVDLTDEFTEDELKNLKSDAEVWGALRSKAERYIMETERTIIDIPCNVTLSYVDLRKAKEFAAIETMNDLGLCDYVTIKDDRLGINYKAKVISTKFDVLTEMYDSIEIGNPTQQLLDTLASIVDFNSDKTVGETITEIEKNLDEYFSEIKVTDNSITFKSGNIKDIEGTYNTYKYKIERDTDIQEEGKLGRIISFTDPQNRKTKIVRE